MRGQVRKRNKSYQISYYTLNLETGKRERQWEGGFPTREAAERALNARLVLAQNNALYDTDNVTLRTYLAEWIEGKDDLAKTTAKRYRGIIDRHWVAVLGGVKLSQLNPLHIEKALREVRHLSGTTQLQHYRVLHAALNDAVMKRLLTDNPCSRVRPPKKVKSVQKALTLVGLHTILTYLKGRSTLWFPTYLAAQTGMRMGEILGLTWENVDLDGGVLYIVGALYYPSRALGWEITLPKDEVTRDVYINEDTVNALKAHHKEQSVQRLKAGESWHDDGFVICDELGVPWLPSTTSSRFRDMSTRAGVPTHFHILRHTAVTLALSTGADMKNVADRTGHSVEMMLRVYAHSDPEVQKMITNRIGVMLK